MAKVTPFSLPFKQQIAFFREKTDVLTESWVDVWQAEHDNAFMVAGANRIDLVADFRDAVRAAIEDGETLEQFRKRFDSIVAKHGWDYNGGRNWRSRVIYETNLRQSYNAGRYAQQMKLAKTLPYIRYRHNDAVQHPRPVHQSWDGKIWRADDPVWQVIFPANGWGCQCYTESLSERDLKRLGKTGPDPSPQLAPVDVLVGQRSPGGPRLVRTFEGIDPGFAYAPGSSLDTWPTGGPKAPRTPPPLQRTLEQSAQDVLRKSTRLPAVAAESMLREIFALQRAQDALQAGYAAFQANAATGGRAGSYYAGMLAEDVLQAMGGRSITPATSAIAAADTNVFASLRFAGTPADVLLTLPALLRNPLAILWDAAQGDLLYVGPADAGALVARVHVARGMPQVQSVVVETDLARLARFPALQGAAPGAA